VAAWVGGLIFTCMSSGTAFGQNTRAVEFVKTHGGLVIHWPTGGAQECVASE